MPSFTAHCKTSKALFGKSYWTLHKVIDSPYKILGRHHRKYYHDYTSAVGFARSLYPGDEVALQAAVFHLQLDEMCSEDPVFKKFIEGWARKRVKKRKSKKNIRAEEQLPDDVVELLKNIERMAEVVRLKKLIYGCKK